MSMNSSDYTTDFSTIFSDARGGGSYPSSIGSVKEDYTNISNIFDGSATSSDWGAATGAAVGTYFGVPQIGADVGRTIFPMIQDIFK